MNRVPRATVDAVPADKAGHEWRLCSVFYPEDGAPFIGSAILAPTGGMAYWEAYIPMSKTERARILAAAESAPKTTNY